MPERTAAPPRRDRSAATRERLLAAGTAEFAAYGFAGGRVDRIARAAGVNKQLIYAYYGDKAGLFDAVIARHVATMADAVAMAIDDLPGYAVRLFDYLEEHPQVTRLLSWRNAERPAVLSSERAAYRAKVEQITRARAAFLPDSPHRPADVLVFILALAQGWAHSSPALRDLADPVSIDAQFARRASLHEAVTRLTRPFYEAVSHITPEERNAMSSESPAAGSAAMRPEDMLEDDVDERVINGVRVRKGTLGAFVMNVKRLSDQPADSPEHAEILAQLRELAPAVRALGMLDVFEPRSSQVRDLLAESETV